MRSIKILILTLVAVLSWAAVAFAAPQEVLVTKSVGTGWYEIWKHANETWTVDGMPGQHKSFLSSPFYPPNFESLKNDYTFTRAQVMKCYPISQMEYDFYGGWVGLNWSMFELRHYNYVPNNLTGQVSSFNANTGSTTLRWDLDLPTKTDPSPDTPPVGPNGPAMNMKLHPELTNKPPDFFAPNAEGWRFYTPALIAWYGVPKGKHDLQFTDAAPQLVGSIEAGKTVNGNIGIKNLAAWPTIASYTKLRVYTWAEGESKPELHNQGGTSSKPISLDGLGEGRLTFSFKVPPKPFRLILTANIYNNGGSYVNEPLVVTTDSGPLSKPEEEYVKNKVEVLLVPSQPGSDGGGGGSTPANLAVTALEILDINGNPVGGTLTAGKAYQVKAKYQSTFDIPGSARIALFCKDSAGNIRQIGNNTWKSLSSKGTAEQTWSWSAGGDSTLIATINLDWRGGTTFNNMQFEGQNEVTYADNKKELSTIVGDAPPVPPTPQRVSTSLYYHPEVTEMLPVYKTVTETIYVPKVVKVLYIKDSKKARIKVRLIESNETRGVVSD